MHLIWCIVSETMYLWVMTVHIEDVGEVWEATISALPALGNDPVWSPVWKPTCLSVSKGSMFLPKSCSNYGESMISRMVTSLIVFFHTKAEIWVSWFSLSWELSIVRIDNVLFVKKTRYPGKVLGLKYQSQFSPLYIGKTTQKIHVKCQVNVKKKLVSMI
jgi:hypothetical protein